MTRWRLASPAGRATPVAVYELASTTSEDLEFALSKIARVVGVAEHRLVRICGIDRGVVARVEPTRALVMPHGGPAVIRAISAELTERLGAETRTWIPPQADIRARVAEALAIARSPLAIDLLLQQPERWAKGSATDPERDRRLRHLIDPPTVVIWGPPNVGKSTLLNTLAGRSASLVDDAAGTTRDHVGVEIDCGGLVCRVLDTPGVRATDDPIEAEAIERATEVAQRADLVVCASDATHELIDSPQPSGAGRRPIRAGLRADLVPPGDEFDLTLSTKTGQGIDAFVEAIRGAFIMPSDLESDLPWQFWDPAGTPMQRS